ncbi:radical SAM protein [Spirillospora sp. NPDC049652]
MFGRLGTGRVLSLMPTWQCTAACDACGTHSSPAVRTRLSAADMKAAIRQAAEAGYELVAFTGGEATLAGRVLLELIELSKSLGLATRLVTNGHWARGPDRARRKIEDFVSAGLDEINFSTGDQHVRFVPLQRVLDGMHASLAGGLRVALMVEITDRRRVTAESIRETPGYVALSRRFPDSPVSIYESPWMPLSPKEAAPYPDGLTANARNVAQRSGCDSILTTTTVQADGSITACCGLGMQDIPELRIGDIRSTPLSQADRAAGEDFLKRWIRVEGPERILAWAATHDPDIEWENMYAHRCQACLRLYQDPAVRRTIRDHHQEKVADVAFAEWLLYQYAGADPAGPA